jgi:hypothetical protein
MPTVHPLTTTPSSASPQAAPARRTLLHPAAGGLILGLDWLLFSGTVVSAGTMLWFSIIGGFLIGGLGTGLIQRRLGGDPPGLAALKGLAGGIAVGIPFPIAGTAVGGAILALSGLDRLLKRRERAALEK